MPKLSPASLMSLEAYAKSRKDFFGIRSNNFVCSSFDQFNPFRLVAQRQAELFKEIRFLLKATTVR